LAGTGGTYRGKFAIATQSIVYKLLLSFSSLTLFSLQVCIGMDVVVVVIQNRYQSENATFAVLMPWNSYVPWKRAIEL